MIICKKFISSHLSYINSCQYRRDYHLKTFNPILNNKPHKLQTHVVKEGVCPMPELSETSLHAMKPKRVQCVAASPDLSLVSVGVGW